MLKQKKGYLKYIFSIIILMAFFKPGVLENYTQYNIIYNYYTVLVSIGIIIIYFFKKSISKFQFIIMIQILIYFISTILGSKDIYTLFAYYVPFLAISMYSEMMIKKNVKIFMNSLSILIYILVLLNFITIIQHPMGLYGEGQYGSFKYFLGYDNASAQTVIIGIVIILINIYMNKHKLGILGISIIIIGMFTYIIPWTVTPLIAFSIASILIIYSIIRQRK